MLPPNGVVGVRQIREARLDSRSWQTVNPYKQDPFQTVTEEVLVEKQELSAPCAPLPVRTVK
jgi:hypothetical protein